MLSVLLFGQYSNSAKTNTKWTAKFLSLPLWDSNSTEPATIGTAAVPTKTNTKDSNNTEPATIRTLTVLRLTLQEQQNYWK